MEMIQEPQEILQREQKQARRPRFPRAFLEEGRFIDPSREATLVLPEKLAVEIPAPVMMDGGALRKAQRGEGFFGTVYEYLLALFERVKRRFGKRRAARRLTKRGQEALEQLRYLALLCDATEMRSNEEILAAEAAFGEAYYEIMKLSGELQRIAQPEEHHHMKHYGRHMSSVLKHTH